MKHGISSSNNPFDLEIELKHKAFDDEGMLTDNLLPSGCLSQPGQNVAINRHAIEITAFQNLENLDIRTYRIIPVRNLAFTQLPRLKTLKIGSIYCQDFNLFELPVLEKIYLEKIKLEKFHLGKTPNLKVLKIDAIADMITRFSMTRHFLH